MAYRSKRSSRSRSGSFRKSAGRVRTRGRRSTGRVSRGGQRGATHTVRIVVDSPANSGQGLTVGPQGFQVPDNSTPRQRQF